jgi:dipeptidyl aminopeptidase/acylaminoacyl peptidase
MQSVCNSIVSGAQCLKLLPYVDEKKIGISGFSWGGHETNWLITQTDLFAAAATGGGMSDPISSALQISETQGKLEEDILGRREDIMGCSIWENQEAWLEASPVLHADKINTPLLIMYNYADKDWQQGGELFMALRRLNKKVWMLQYDNGDHSVYQRDREDLTIRITQFFDFFLKGSRPASWMTKGIPARLKGVETGYETDTNW